MGNKKVIIFAPDFSTQVGVLAQVARAFDWQSKGHEFDSHILHKKRSKRVAFLFPSEIFFSLRNTTRKSTEIFALGLLDTLVGALESSV